MFVHTYASLPRIQLTTVAQLAFEMEQTAADWLLAVTEGRQRRNLRQVVKPYLIVRCTTAPPICRHN